MESWKKTCLIPFHAFAIILSLLSYGYADQTVKAKRPTAITVVSDDSYPPYIFRNSEGKLQGIIIDQWNLWEKKTGIKVNLIGMDWVKALKIMDEGKAEVIDTIFDTEERTAKYDFTKPYATVKVSVFFHKNISGISDVNSLHGFTVGVKEGDTCIEILRRHGINTLQIYNSYEEIVEAAAKQKIRVFCMDEPPALYYLYKMNIEDEYRHSLPFFSGRFHRAVRKGGQDLLDIVEAGFSKISQSEYAEIDKKWMGSLAGTNPAYMYYALYSSLGAVLLAFILILWNYTLRKRVFRRTCELHQALVALEESERFLANIVENIPDMIFVKDAEEFRFVRFNKAGEELLGCSRQELTGKNVHDLFPKDVADFFEEKDREALRCKHLVDIPEEKIVTGSMGERILHTKKIPIIDEAGITRFLLGISEDITVRKQNEEERALLATVVEQSEENVLITDNHRTILYVNPAFERSSGYKVDELKGQKIKVLRSDQHDSAFYRVMKETLDRGDVWMGVIINKGKDGSDFEIEGTISPLRDTTGAIVHYVAVGRNMSRFRKLERELQQKQKMEALGTLAGGIAHDFNNVLTAVMGNVDLEFMGAEEGSLTRRRMEQALSACSRARELVKQILTFSRQSEQRLKPFDIGSVVEDAVKMLRATIPTTIDIRPNIGTAQAVVLGNPIQIHQVLVNLCTNAAHAMQDIGGTIEIGLASVEIGTEQAGEHLDLKPGSYVRLTISDTGHGMDRNTVERIFEPFFTTKKPGEGTGMGLAVVHGIVKSHSGAIRVYSEPQKGSTFQVFFPLTESAVEYTEKPVAPLPAGTERILLVDDEEVVACVASEMLETLGYEVVSVNDSLEALTTFKSQQNLFDLILTDLTMPGNTGMELAAELLNIKRDIPIILCTGFTSTEVRKQAIETGIREVMTKPYHLHELAETVRRVLDK